ncbi:MAG TPA: Eco57I restriction-modification methylase domain-containing protein [Myxococcota bacterium]|nr:Eco57I restriction-modification methylase domain-containing protein [Myxococcota bacterium]HPV04594.1 Eco57I restriction-modification methylase domain-containing protein [Myxococcota bacterium]
MAVRLPQSESLGVSEFLRNTEASRKMANVMLDESNKSSLGQFMTPVCVASFMASMFDFDAQRQIRLLDPGAGVGSLTSALVARIAEFGSGFSISADAFEIDEVMRRYLPDNLQECRIQAELAGNSFEYKIFPDDFVSKSVQAISAARSLWGGELPGYTHCIMNPPYRKIPGNCHHAAGLKSIGIDAVNLYSAFMALAIELLEPGGQLVAIVPRSFCNGSYYRPFREFLLKRSAIVRMHLFASRKNAFKDDNVLQENIVVKLVKGGCQGYVLVTSSTDQSLADMSHVSFPFNQIVLPEDAEKYIHVPTDSRSDCQIYPMAVRYSLADIGIDVSTGPVVDFRHKKDLFFEPADGTVPLVYSCHFSGQRADWPKIGGKKPNAIAVNADTARWLFPMGCYVVSRRFSSKEERRRVVASLFEPELFPGFPAIGFENHLNVFHSRRRGLPRNLALGLVVYLNSSLVDACFRRFSGHTQVNATDLRLMKYPSRDALVYLGDSAESLGALSQEQIDDLLRKVIDEQ